MKQLKLVSKRILIIYIIIFIVLSSMSSCLARGYDEKCGEYAAQWAIEFIDKNAGSSQYSCSGNLGSINGKTSCNWSGGTQDNGYGSGTFYGCCTCWVHWIFYYALGVDINDMGFDPLSDTAYANLKGGNEYFDDVSGQTLQAGDILIVNGHAEMYAGDGTHANFGSTPMNHHAACSRMTPGQSSEGAIAVRLKNSVQVNPAGSVAVEELEDEDLNIYDENGFIYTGVAKIDGYKSSTTFLGWIQKMLTQIIDYLIGILTLGFRIVAVGWTAIVERFFMDGIVNAITGVTNKRDENWEKDPDKIDEIDQEVQQEEAENQSTDKSQATGDKDKPNEYISEGMQGVADIGGKVQLKTSSKANVTVENIVYNKIPILDINFFNFESAGGAVVDQDGIIYIIKENVAMWYYVFRIMAIVAMLAVLIYLGIKMTITTVAEKKAVYKQMMLSWLAGFILVFAINYIMYGIIHLNEQFISWLIPKYEDGTEISLYETVRTKAYELKATSGFAGMIMYMILVYYAIRFLLIYFKRYLTVTILALISPFVAVVYAIKKVTSNGGNAQIFSNWFMDFLYTVVIQAIHALIYTVFVDTALELTETSVAGIVIAFFFLKAMIDVDPIIRKIFGLQGKNGAKLSVTPLASQLAILSGAKKALKKSNGFRKAANLYGKTVGFGPKVVKKAAGKISNGIGDAKKEFITKYGSTEYYSKEKIKEREEKKKARNKKINEITKGIGQGLEIGGRFFDTGMKFLAAIPLIIVEPELGIKVLDASFEAGKNLKKTIQAARRGKVRPKSYPNTKRFKLKGIQPKSRAGANKLMKRLSLLGIPFAIAAGGTAYTRGKKPGTAGNERKEIGQIKMSQLTEEQRRRLAAKIGTAKTLRYAKPSMTIEEVLEEGDFDKAEAYADLLVEARKQEQELELQFRELTGRMDDDIAAMEKIDPRFASAMKDKKTKELANAALILAKPLSEKDIYRAVQNYKSKVPQFNEAAERISSRDVEGIAKEINAVLKQKGTDMEMSKEFIDKVQQQLTDNQRRMQEEKERREQHDVAGQDVSAKAKGKSITPQQKSLKEQIKDLSRGDPNNPYAAENANAPKQNGEKENTLGSESGSSVERLVRNIRNASRGTASKTVTVTPKTMDFAKRIEALDRLSEQVSNITGEQLYDLDDVFRRLEAL